MARAMSNVLHSGNKNFLFILFYDSNSCIGGPLKALPANPRDYISRTYKISPREGRQYVQKFVGKALKIEKIEKGLSPIKKVDKQAVGPINVIF